MSYPARGPVVTGIDGMAHATCGRRHRFLHNEDGPEAAA